LLASTIHGRAQSSLLLKDIQSGPSSSLPARFVDIHGTCFFTAGEAVHGHALWKTDGTLRGTVLVKDFFPGPGGGVQPRELVNMDGLLFCFADDSVHGGELWASDGTTKGTYMVKDINPGNQGRPVYMDPPTNLTPWKGHLYFSARDGRHGRELMRTDGTAAGTKLVKDINVGNNSSDSHPSYLTPVGDTLFFFGFEPRTGWELWKTNGLAAGTQLVKDVWPGPEPTLMTHNRFPFVVGILNEKILLFAAPDAVHGYELWRSDGTAAGTFLVKDITKGTGHSWFNRNFTPFGGKVFFTVDDKLSGQELWATDGTTKGTHLVKDIYPGTTGSKPGWMAVVQNKLLFTANDAVHGHELWVTDGTTAGTKLLVDIRRGSASSMLYSRLYRLGSRYVYFAADNGSKGSELWRSDGTITGTKLVQDIAPGYATSYPEYLTLSGGKVIFRAKDSTYGQEPRVFFPGATAQRVGRGTTPNLASPATPPPSLHGEDPVLGTKPMLSGVAHAVGRPILLLMGAQSKPLSFPHGCLGYLDISSYYIPIQLVVPATKAWSTSLPIPLDSRLSGISVMLQAFQFNALLPGGFDSSNGLVLTLGN